MRWAPLFIPLLFGAAGACGNDDSVSEFADPDVTINALNPDGVPYPTDRIGRQKRNGTFPGDRIPNFAFRGYRNGDRSQGLQTISLADYFDPQQSRYKILHLQVAATWCAICSSEIEATISVTKGLLDRGVVVLEVIVSGNTLSKGPALNEVDSWVQSHHSDITTAIDVRGRRLGGIGVDTAVVPHDILIDVRTMEILDSSVGAPLDVAHYDLGAVDFVTANPPSY